MTVLGQKEISMANQRLYVIDKLPEGSEKRAQVSVMSDEEFELRFFTAWHYMLYECFMPELHSILNKYCTGLPEDNSLVKRAEYIYVLADTSDTYDGVMCFILELIIEAACQGMCDLECELRALATKIYRF